MRATFSYSCSAVLHLIVLWLLARAHFWLPVRSGLPAGPASIALQSSALASPRAVADPVTEITPYDGRTRDSVHADDSARGQQSHRGEAQLNVVELAALPVLPDGEVIRPVEWVRDFRPGTAAAHGHAAAGQGAMPPRRRPTPAEYEVVVELYDHGSAASLTSREAAGPNLDQLPRPLAGNPTPPYPPDALAANQQGRVILSVFVGANGSVVRAKLVKSSGTQSLDEAAMATVQLWRFSPARRGGTQVAFEVLVPIRFEINEG